MNMTASREAGHSPFKPQSLIKQKGNIMSPEQKPREDHEEHGTPMAFYLFIGVIGLSMLLAIVFILFN